MFFVLLLKIAPLSAMADPRKLGTGDWKTQTQ